MKRLKQNAAEKKNDACTRANLQNPTKSISSSNLWVSLARRRYALYDQSRTNLGPPVVTLKVTRVGAKHSPPKKQKSKKIMKFQFF